MQMKNKKLLLLCILLLVAVALAGCWDTQDISNRAYVTAIGLDAGEGGAKYKVTFEIVKASELTLQSREPANIIETANADSIATAQQQIQAKIARIISMSHLRIVVVGESLARDDFKNALEYFQKHPDIALRLRLAFARGEALEVLRAKPLSERYMAMELVRMSQMLDRYSLVRTNPFIKFTGDLRANNGTALGPTVLPPRAGRSIASKGAAVFRNWKLIGWLDDMETQQANCIIGKAECTFVGRLGNGTYVYRAESNSAKIIPAYQNGAVEFTVVIKMTGPIVDEQQTNYNYLRPASMEQMEKLFSGVVKKQVEAAIAKSQQELQTDYLGFGLALQRRWPKIYRSLNWEEVYPHVPITVQVEASVTRSGLSHKFK